MQQSPIGVAKLDAKSAYIVSTPLVAKPIKVFFPEKGPIMHRIFYIAWMLPVLVLLALLPQSLAENRHQPSKSSLSTKSLKATTSQTCEPDGEKLVVATPSSLNSTAPQISSHHLPHDIGDQHLHTIATRVFRQADHLGSLERLIVISNIQHTDRVEHRLFAGKLEPITRTSTEFQVATVESENGRYFLYHNTLRRRNLTGTDNIPWELAKRSRGQEVSFELL